MVKWLRSPRGVVIKPEVFEETKCEGKCKCMNNPHILIFLIIPFPNICDLPCGSSWLRRYSLLNMESLKYG
jgi:hypothetical protein